MDNHWVMDYETMINCFVGVFEHYKTDEQKIFIIHELQNDFIDLVKFLEQNKENGEKHISYNGLAFDAQITEYILKNSTKWAKLSGDEVVTEIYKMAQYVIERSNAREWLDFYEYNMSIPQLDVYKLNHWDNAAKRSSLKWIQFSMDWYNLQDMPIKHDEFIHSREDLDIIINYCINDVKSTKEILYKSKDLISLRKDLTNKYKINLYNASEPKISKELFLHFLSKKSGVPKNDIKYSSTNRKEIIVKDILLDYISFNNLVFKELHEKFKEKVIYADQTKGGFKTTVKFHGVKTHFGLGGVHGARPSGVYENNEDMMIMTSDVTSFYPNLAIKNKWSPAHLPKEDFCEQYEWFFNERKLIPKTDIRNYTYKIILNSTYGLSNDKFSFLYDPQFTMQVTINGQLSLMMLYEMIMDGIPGAIPIMQNTDGLETMIPRTYEDKYLEISKKWEEITKLNLEHDKYQKLILADVNSYIAVNTFKEVTKDEFSDLKKNPHNIIKEEDGKYYHAKTKCKGRFEFQDLPLHKNKSNLIFDYCIGVKIKGNWTFKMRWIDEELKEEALQKTIRYYVSNHGSKIYKCNNADGREIQAESGKWLLKLFNVYKKKAWKDYNVNEQYYLKSIYREIENIAGPKLKQLKLF